MGRLMRLECRVVEADAGVDAIAFGVAAVVAVVVVAAVAVAERTEPPRIQKGVTFESSLDVDQNSVLKVA